MMEKTLISWNVPNLITIWLMLAIGFLVFAVGSQFALKWARPANDTSNGSGGY